MSETVSSGKPWSIRHLADSLDASASHNVGLDGRTAILGYERDLLARHGCGGGRVAWNFLEPTDALGTNMAVDFDERIVMQKDLCMTIMRQYIVRCRASWKTLKVDMYVSPQDPLRGQCLSAAEFRLSLKGFRDYRIVQLALSSSSESSFGTLTGTDADAIEAHGR